MAEDKMDARVMKLIEEVKKRRERVGYLKKPQWLTSCSLQLPGMDRLNLHVCTDLGLLVFVCGTLKRIDQDTADAAKELDVEIEEKWQNYPIADWIKDIKLRIQITQIKAEQDKLNKLEKKLTPLISDDLRRKMALEEIEADLNE